MRLIRRITDRRTGAVKGYEFEVPGEDRAKQLGCLVLFLWVGMIMTLPDPPPEQSYGTPTPTPVHQEAD